MNQQHLNVEAGFRKGRGTRNQIANIYRIIQKARDSRKTPASASLTSLKSLNVWIIANQKIFQEMGIPDDLTYLLRNLYAVQKATEPDMKQQTGSKLGEK